MTTTTHTPGPWLAEPDGESDWKVRSEDWGTIVHRNCYPDAKVDTTVEADARLIAAAPELLDLLARALPFVEEAESDPAYKPGFVHKLTREIRDVIERLEQNRPRPRSSARGAA